jgi:hypothetical protein
VDEVTASLAQAGIDRQDLEWYEGGAAANAFDGTGRAHGRLGRVRRAVQFSLMDQMPDLAWYEAALRDGRIVVAVPTQSRPITLAVVDALVGAGAHFVNRFGRLETEEFVRWRGPEPQVHGLLRR